MSAKSKQQQPEKAAKATANASQQLKELGVKFDNLTVSLANISEAFTSYIDNNEKKLATLMNELDNHKNLSQAIVRKLNAAIEVGNISEAAIAQILQDMSVQEMKMKVDNLVQQKIIVQDNDKEIEESDFIVVRQLDLEGNVSNPRIQFVVSAVNEDSKKLLVGKKVGDLVSGGDKFNLEVMEIFKEVPPEPQDIKFDDVEQPE